MNSNTIIFAILTVSTAIISFSNISSIKKWIEGKSVAFQKSLNVIKNILFIGSLFIGTLFTIKNNNEEQKGKKEEAKYAGVKISPELIGLPAKSNANIPVTITNNYPFPIYYVGVEFKMIKGNISMDRDTEFYPLCSGVVSKDYISRSIYQINAKSTLNCLYQIKGENSDLPIEISLSLGEKAYKNPGTFNFEMKGQKNFPKSIAVPKGFGPSEEIVINPNSH